MRFLQRLVKNGNSTMVTIPVQVLDFCRWSSGKLVIVEPTETRGVTVREATAEDLHAKILRGRIPVRLDESTP